MHKNGQENDMPEASQAHNELFPQGLIVSQNIVFLKFMIKYNPQSLSYGPQIYRFSNK